MLFKNITDNRQFKVQTRPHPGGTPSHDLETPSRGELLAIGVVRATIRHMGSSTNSLQFLAVYHAKGAAVAELPDTLPDFPSFSLGFSAFCNPSDEGSQKLQMSSKIAKYNGEIPLWRGIYVLIVNIEC